MEPGVVWAIGKVGPEEKGGAKSSLGQWRVGDLKKWVAPVVV